MKLNLEDRIRCSDQTKLRLVDVVIDPLGRTVTHVIVSRLDDGAQHRLVPVDELDDTGESGLRLACTAAGFEAFPSTRRSDFIDASEAPVATPGWAVGITEWVAHPHFRADFGESLPNGLSVAEWDEIPAGEVEIRRNSTVTSADGVETGHVDGFVCNDDGNITHVVLQHGTAFVREDLAIPIGEVEQLDNGAVTVRLTHDELDALPGVSVHRWHRPR